MLTYFYLNDIINSNNIFQGAQLMKKETEKLLETYRKQIANIANSPFKHYSQGPADPRPYIEGGTISPYYDYSEGSYSQYKDW